MGKNETNWNLKLCGYRTIVYQIELCAGENDYKLREKENTKHAQMQGINKIGIERCGNEIVCVT